MSVTPQILSEVLLTWILVGVAYRVVFISVRRAAVMGRRDRDLSKRRAASTAGLPSSLCAAAAGLTLTPTAWRRLGEVLQRPADEFRPDETRLARERSGGCCVSRHGEEKTRAQESRNARFEQA